MCVSLLYKGSPPKTGFQTSSCQEHVLSLPGLIAPLAYPCRMLSVDRPRALFRSDQQRHILLRNSFCRPIVPARPTSLQKNSLLQFLCCSYVKLLEKHFPKTMPSTDFSWPRGSQVAAIYQNQSSAVIMSCEFFGPVLCRADFQQISILEPPDLVADFPTGVFLLILWGKVSRKSSRKIPPQNPPKLIRIPQKSPTHLSRPHNCCKCNAPEHCLVKQIGQVLMGPTCGAQDFSTLMMCVRTLSGHC